MGRWETFDHTADLGLRIHAADLDDLYRTAAEALFDTIVVNREQVQAAEPLLLALEAESVEALLIDWLNELIYHAETEHRLFSRFDVAVDPAGCRLSASVWGEAIDEARHVLDHEVKAVTRHGAVVAPAPEGWRAEVILDI